MDDLPEKVKESVWEKLSETLMLIQEKEPSSDTTPAQKEKQKKVNVITLQIEKPEAQSAPAGKLKAEALEKYKLILKEKGSHKDWT